ncbi:MAG: hypothetical protein DSM106950_05935 [Stigonema ocellatum SAG 48.90 = DSM 106950]|nr:hypothetical protein [Stigonema ocellatum SAG 48.90 = DSM 106950]
MNAGSIKFMLVPQTSLPEQKAIAQILSDDVGANGPKGPKAGFKERIISFHHYVY